MGFAGDCKIIRENACKEFDMPYNSLTPNGKGATGEKGLNLPRSLKIYRYRVGRAVE
jgi:hypothetical protein